MTESKNKGRFWMFLPVMLLGASVLGWIVMVRYAVHDASFSVEPNYYQKAITFDADQARRNASAALGYHLVIERFERRAKTTILAVSVLDKNGAKVRGLFGSGLGFPIARGNESETLTLREDAFGNYTTAFEGGRFGLWEIRFVFTKDRTTFLHDARVDLVPSSDGV